MRFLFSLNILVYSKYCRLHKYLQDINRPCNDDHCLLPSGPVTLRPGSDNTSCSLTRGARVWHACHLPSTSSIFNVKGSFYCNDEELEEANALIFFMTVCLKIGPRYHSISNIFSILFSVRHYQCEWKLKKKNNSCCLFLLFSGTNVLNQKLTVKI